MRLLAARATVAAAALLCSAGSLALRAPTDADYRPIDMAAAQLGQLLFYDPILSGGRNISCGTCHSARFGTSDGVALDLGEGATGMGPERRAGATDIPEKRVPRNAPALFNLGATEFARMFFDGRVETDPSRPSGLRTPLEDEMVTGFASVLSAQTMFPVLAPDEMAGHYKESDVSKLVRSGRMTGPGGAWDVLAKRVAAIPAYQTRFAAAYPEIAAGRPVAFTDIANAIAQFIAFEWRSDGSPFDRYLRHQAPLGAAETAGMQIFYGRGGCGACHSGPFQTDQAFHAMGEPQLGPGKGERFESTRDDIGRMRVTGDPADAYAFRTPSLRNVTETAPYGHAGAHRTLEGFIRYHADPVAGMAGYVRDVTLTPLPLAKNDWAVMDDPAARATILAAVTTPPVRLSDADVANLVAFLAALRDETALKGRLGVPDSVPSGLPIDR